MLKNPTLWALARAKEIVECEGNALVMCTKQLNIDQAEAESTLLGVAISEALLEAYSLGAQSTRHPNDEAALAPATLLIAAG